MAARPVSALMILQTTTTHTGIVASSFARTGPMRCEYCREWTAGPGGIVAAES